MSQFSKHSNPSSLQDAVIYGLERDAFDDEVGQSLMRAYESGYGEGWVEQMIRQRVWKLRTQEAFGQLNPFRWPRLRHGEIVLGFDLSGRPIPIPVELFKQNLLIASNTGGGKSNLISWLLPQIAAQGRAVWMVDSYKQQLRHLRPIFGRLP